MQKLNEDMGENVTVSVSAGSNQLRFEVQAKIAFLTGEQIEPEKKEGDSGSFIYFSNRPTETFVIYILNRIVLDGLADNAGKPISALHIHDNVNTEGCVICWPQRIDSVEAAKKVLLDWAGLIGALYVSDKNDINEFYHAYNRDEGWMTQATTDNQVKVTLQQD